MTIVSASRRTDLPAFHGDWFVERLRAGFVDVANPFNAKQVRRVDLRPENLTGFVFWTRDASRFHPVLDLLDKRGDRYYFLHTLTPYGRDLEPKLFAQAPRIQTFRRLSSRLGPDRVIWRYDPILLGHPWDADWHRAAFERLSKALAGATQRVIISMATYYRKTDRRLKALEDKGATFDRQAGCQAETLSLLAELNQVATDRGMHMQSCASEVDLAAAGVQPGACVDALLFKVLWGIDLPQKKDPGQRKACACAPSMDIGTNDTCAHACLYCYANR